MLNDVHNETVDEICKAYGEPSPKGVYYMGRVDFNCNEKGEQID